MIETTIHGDNIAAQIAGKDAYGRRGTLNAADVREIIDQIHTNLLDGGQEDSPLMAMITRWLDEAEMMARAAKEMVPASDTRGTLRAIQEIAARVLTYAPDTIAGPIDEIWRLAEGVTSK